MEKSCCPYNCKSNSSFTYCDNAVKNRCILLDTNSVSNCIASLPNDGQPLPGIAESNVHCQA